MADQTVAKTILQQLGGNKFLVMTGAKQLVSSADSLSFVLPRAEKRIKKVVVRLDPSDTYTIEFGRIDRKTFEWVSIAKHDGIYFDQLATIFTSETGLYTHL